MAAECPNGFFHNGLLVYGSGLDPFAPAVVAKGFLVECPDRVHASDQFNIDLHGQIRRMLHALGGGYRIQLCWSVDSDYEKELVAYAQETERDCHDPYPRQVRTQTFLRFHDAMRRRLLRRERLVLYVSKRITAKPPLLSSTEAKEAYYEKLLKEFSREFELFHVLLSNNFGPSNVRFTPLDDRGHFLHGLTYLNPAYVTRHGHDPLPEFFPNDTLQENWVRGALEGGRQHLPAFGFRYHGLFWNILTIRRLPDETSPNTVLTLTQTDLLDYSITVNLYPKEKDRAVNEERDKLRRAHGSAKADPNNPEFEESIRMIEERIKAIRRGTVHPYDADFIIRIWAETPEELASKTQVIRTIVNRADGCKEHEPLTFSTNKRLWWQSWPGWVFGTYTHQAKYFEDTDLAAMLPFSSTFTGHLKDAEVIHPGPNRSLVGIRTFLGNPTQPQHAALMGMSGTGKSQTLKTILAQGHHRYAYTYLIDEGFEFADYVRDLEGETIIIRPNGNETINYLDTNGLPLSVEQKAEAASLCAYMIGAAADEDLNRKRQSLFGRYIDQLYTDFYEEWAKTHPRELLTLAREAMGATAWLATMERGEKEKGSPTFEDAWVEAHLPEKADRWNTILADLSDAEVTQFLKTPATEDVVRNCAFARLRPQEMPTHSHLVELMLRMPLPQHDRREVQDLAERLNDWSRTEGTKGKLFDGVTNVSLTGGQGRMVCFELSLLGTGESPLKTAAYFLVMNRCRRHIMTMPRQLLKRAVIEEAGRVADIPDGSRMMEEMAAQLRKYNCWACYVFQNDAQLDNPKTRKVVLGNIKQAFLGRQRSPNVLRSIAGELDLPEAACQSVANYPLPEHINYAFSQFLYFQMDASRPLCGTITVTKNPPFQKPAEAMPLAA